MNPVFKIHTWVIPLSCSFPRYLSLSVICCPLPVLAPVSLSKITPPAGRLSFSLLLFSFPADPYLLGPKLFLQAISYYTVPLLSKLEPQPPPWLWPTAPPRVPRSSSLQTARSPHLFKALTPLPGASSMAKTNIIYVEEKKNETKRGGSTNMPLFGRAHECKEYEHWIEKKVWIVSGMKWTLPKNRGDPHRDTSETQSQSRPTNEHKGSNPKTKWCIKMPLKPH